MNSRPALTIESSYKDICKRLADLTTESICDAYPKVRLMDKHREKKIHAINKNSDQCIGRVYTINSAQDSLSTMQALSDLQAFLAFLDCKDDIVPTILMIASCGADFALAGGVCARVAKKAGFGGVITDGYYRDKKEVLASELPFFARGRCAISGTKDKVGTIKRKINCGDVEVNPGDIVLADIGGVVVMSKNEAVAAISKAEEMKKGEEILLYKIEVEGAQFNETCNIDKHVENINEGISSKFKMT